MKAILVIAVVLGLLLFGAIQMSDVYTTKQEIKERAEFWLDQVNENSIDTVKSGMIKDAEKIGVKLDASQIRITYKDTERQTVAQKMVKDRVAKFSNKEAVMTITYDKEALGFTFHQEVVAQRIKIVSAQPHHRDAEIQRYLDEE